MKNACKSRELRTGIPGFAALLFLLCSLGVTGCAHSPAYDPQDPLEAINRPIFTFNRKADQYVLRPVAVAYVKVIPEMGRRGVANFFRNLCYPVTIVNDLLQGKVVQTGQDALRFVMNSTIGLAGFIDVASTQGLQLHNEDLGQTFGRWGIGQGWYLMLPLFGPSTNRDLLGRVGDSWAEILPYISQVSSTDRLVVKGVGVVNLRSRLLDADHLLDEQLDPYVFLRTTYLEHRQDLVFDGNPPPDIADLDEDDDAGAASAATDTH